MRLTFSMPVLIAAVVVVSMSTLGAALMAQGWFAGKEALITSAHDSTLAIGERIDERFERHLTPATVTLRHLALGPLATAGTEEQRLQQLPLLTEILVNLPAAAAVLAGYADGDFFLVRAIRTPADASVFKAPSNSAYLVQSITHPADGEPVETWLYYDEALRLIETRTQPPNRFDPRTRAWYIGALDRQTPYLTPPYRFATTRKIGLTLSIAAPDRGAVVALEENLSDLGATLSDLRLTPHTELAVVDTDGNVYGYVDLKRIYGQAGEEIRPRSVAQLDVPALSALAAMGAPPRQTVTFDIEGEPWYGVSVPLASFQGRELSLLVAIPDGDLLAGARAALTRQLWLALELLATLLAIAWLVGRALGHSLTQLAQRAGRLKRFDFHAPPPRASRIREVRHLDEVLAQACRTIENFLAIAETIGSEPGLDRMLEKVLEQTVAATGSHAGAVYLVDATGQDLTLSAVAARTPQQLEQPEQPEQPHPRAKSAAENADGPFPRTLPPATLTSGADAGETTAGAPCRHAVPLTDRQDKPVGLLLLDQTSANAQDGEDFRAFTERLSGALSSAIETRQLFEAQKELLDGFVLLIADAIDAKSPYTGGHCRRVPELATMMVDRMSSETEGPFREFHFSAAQRYEFHLGAWLHDCGKVTSPEHIIDKATKLEAIHNRIHEIRTRFEVLWRDAEIAHLQRLRAGAGPEASKATRDGEQARLKEDFAFVAASNVGGELMTDEAKARIREIASRTWLRHFDDRLGLSLGEERRLDGVARAELPAQEKLLADRPEHLLAWGAHRPAVEKGEPGNPYGFDMKLPEHQENRGEIYNLSIGRGTLTDEDRFKINDHVVRTYTMLKSLPWPDHLARVPEIASTHHERMDGKGYPRRLPGEKLSTEERVIALVDIFEALTAADRPYKPPKTLSQSLRIMAFMCKEGHLDPEIFRYFLKSRLWEAYAERHLNANQRDAVDADALCALLPQETAA